MTDYDFSSTNSSNESHHDQDQSISQQYEMKPKREEIQRFIFKNDDDDEDNNDDHLFIRKTERKRLSLNEMPNFNENYFTNTHFINKRYNCNTARSEQLKSMNFFSDDSSESDIDSIRETLTVSSNIKPNIMENQIAEIEILKEIINNHNTKIQSMNEDIKLLRSENESLTHLMDHWRIMLENKLDSINSEMRATFHELKQEIEVERNQNKGQIKDNKDTTKLDKEMKSFEPRKSLERKIAGIYVWNIDRVMEKRKKRGAIWSEYFYTRNKQYKMRLQFHPNGFVCTGTGLSIYLFLYPSEINTKLSWPFKADVTVKIINKAIPNKSKILTKYCHVDKPIINPYKCCASFDFIYQDLYLDGLFQDDYFSIECFVNVK